MTHRKALELLQAAHSLLNEIDERAAVVAPARRNGRHGEGQMEFRIRLWVNETNLYSLDLPDEPSLEDGYVLFPLPQEKENDR